MSYPPDWTAALRIMGVKAPRLTPRQVEILSILRRRIGEWVSIKSVAHIPDKACHARVYHLRKKLNGSLLDIEARWGQGYRLVTRRETAA